MPLQGTFDVLDFTEVLQLLSSRQLTGRLHVRSRAYGAYLFVEEGLLVGADQSEHQPAATAGDVRGRLEEVCFEMLEAERGSFEFHPGKPTTLPVGERFKAEEVLTQAHKRLEEWHQLQEVIPSLDLQPRLVLDLSATEVTFDRERWRMLTAVDGRRNLRAIGRVLNLSDFDVCRVMSTLVDDGIVELDGLGALPAATRDAMPVVPPPGVERPAPPAEERPTVVITASIAPANGARDEDRDGWEPSPGLAPLAEPAPAAGPAESGGDGNMAPGGEDDATVELLAADDATVHLPVPDVATDPGAGSARPPAGGHPGAAGPSVSAAATEAPGDGGAAHEGRRGRRVVRIRSKGSSA
ncbi:MAG: DUF4388 domain-containing protein [Actinomycetota bacterium]|nr:DUF4388 domain-containing protein [Actinomycetota bacterium]